MNKETHIDSPRRARDAVGTKAHPPPKRRINRCFLLHNNAPAHRSVQVKDFLAKNGVTTFGHPLYSSDLAPADLYLFPSLKSALKRRRFCDATDIIKNSTEELKRLAQNFY